MVTSMPRCPFRDAVLRTAGRCLSVMCLLSALGAANCYASFERQPQPAALRGRGLSGCALSGSDFSLINPASIAQIARASVTLFYSPSPFGLSELSNGGAALAVPLPLGTLQAAVTATGQKLYHEQSMFLSYALALDDAVVFGASLSYNALSIERYGAAHTFGVDIGLYVAPVPRLTLGAAILNANRPTIGIEQDELPRMFLIGMAYMLSDYADFSADLVKDIRFPESVRVGIEVRPIQFVALRTGMSTGPHRFHAGAGLRIESFRFDYSITTHQELELTHSLGLSLEF